MTALAESISFGPTLVLNADYRPLSYFPLSTWSWQDAIRAVYAERVQVLSHYDAEVRSPSYTLRVPSVIALKEYASQNHKPVFSRFNLFLRDRFTCQYCNKRFAAHALTFDHVIPRTHGGRTTWQNVVAACTNCNTHKGAKTLAQSGLSLRQAPRIPSLYQLQENGRGFPPSYLHHSWRDFLYWDSELET